MRFTHSPVYHPERRTREQRRGEELPSVGTSTRVWVPQLEGEDDPIITRPDKVTKFDFDGSAIRLSTPLLQIAAEFLRDPKKRAELGHNAAVFALACVTGDSQEGILFNQPGGKTVKFDFDAEELPRLVEPSTTQAGETILTSGADPNEDRETILSAVPNLLVRANVDYETPLYLSKLGREGPVVLADFARMTEIYPATTVAIADGFHAADFPQ